MAEGEKKSPIILIAGVLVFALLLAGGISYFIATKIVADKNGGGVEKKAAQHEPGVFMKLGDMKDGLVINMGGLSSGRYLKIGVIVELKPEKKVAGEAAGAKGMPTPEEIKILDTTVSLLRSQKLEDFDPTKQEQLKELIKNEINKTFGDEKVYEVYITNFVLQ